jgi:hypothetical protein
VNTPDAAAVAAITAGLVGALHMPNIMTFVIGIWSIMVAAGTLPVLTLPVGKTVIVLGVAPKEH